MRKIICVPLTLLCLMYCHSRSPEQIPPNVNGDWVYRSTLNIPDENVPFCKADSTGCASDIEFATAVMRLKSEGKKIAGILDMGSFGKLTLEGNFVSSNSFQITGTGLINTSTQGWIYDYFGYTIPSWEQGVDQKETLVGSVVRSADHGNAKKGKVASFYLVKK